MTANTNPLAVHGHIAYVEIPSTDLESSARFYETIFGWNVRRKSAKNVSFDDPTGNLIGRWSLDKRVSDDAGIIPYIYVNGIDQIIAQDSATARRNRQTQTHRRRHQPRDFPRPFGQSAGRLAVHRMIRVVLPQHLQVLAGAPREVTVNIAGAITVHAILTALEAKYPTLRGAIRDHDTHKRRPMVRFFACQDDISLDPDDTPLPDAIAGGAEPLYIIGAIAGG